jgi:hypothetical protein
MSTDMGEAGGRHDHQGSDAWSARGASLTPDRTSAEQNAVAAAATGTGGGAERLAGGGSGTGPGTGPDAGSAEADLTAVAAASTGDQSDVDRVQPVAGDPGTSYDRGDLAVEAAFTGDGQYSEGDAAGSGLSDAPTGVPHEAT